MRSLSALWRVVVLGGAVGLLCGAPLVSTDRMPAMAQESEPARKRPDGSVDLARLVLGLTAESSADIAIAAAELVALREAAAPAIPDITQLLTNPAPATRTAAYETLARLGPTAASPLLTTLHSLTGNAEKAELRAWTAGALWELGDDAVPAVDAWLTSSEPARQRTALEVIGWIAPDRKELARKGAGLLTAKDPAVQEQAYRLVATLGADAEACVKRLTLVVGKRKSPTRKLAAQTLGAILIGASTAPQAAMNVEDDLERSIADAHTWLTGHQEIDGAGCWSPRAFSELCREAQKCEGPGAPEYVVGITGLTTMALLPAVEDHRVASKEPLALRVRRALHYLIGVIDPEGCIGERTSAHYMYNHATASHALIEAYGRCRNPLYAYYSQRAVQFIEAARNVPAPGKWGAWRYGIRDGGNDTSLTSWNTAALRLAELAGLTVDPQALVGGLRWLDEMTEPEFGRVGYQQKGGQPARTTEMMDQFPAAMSESMTSIALTVRSLLGRTLTNDPYVKKGAALCALKPPVWSPALGKTDLYYWMNASVGLWRVGGPSWHVWRPKLLQAAYAGQSRVDEVAFGSWGPVGPWGPEGGRVASTAMMLLSLEAASGRVRRFRRVELTRSVMKRALAVMTKVANNPREKDAVVKLIAAGTLRQIQSIPAE